ncbi:hypothetical protein C7212DRAFT_281865, partial [Tuber magnatum]
IKILLQREDVNPNTVDTKGRTPLSLALSKGHHTAVRILQERDNVNSGPAGPAGQASVPLATEHVGGSR